jgi:hypothetical protein
MLTGNTNSSPLLSKQRPDMTITQVLLHLRITLGGKDGRCVRVTTLPPS